MEDLKHASKCISDRLKSLSYGPNFSASLYSGFVINGCTFYTREQDEHSTMHNSGVTLEAEALHFASAKDKHPVYCKMHYYGVIEETLVNLNKIGHKKDPFILASQAKQVFYVTDPSDKRMSVVISPGSRHIIDDHEGDIAMEEESLIRKVQLEIDDNDESSTYVRNDHGEGMLMAKKRKQRSQSEDNLASDPEDEAFDAKKIRREDERGHTVLAKVGKAIHSGTKIPVEWHPTRNVPRGDNRITLSTYIGVIVRERVSINYKKWSDVPKEMKNEVCEFIMFSGPISQLSGGPQLSGPINQGFGVGAQLSGPISQGLGAGAKFGDFSTQRGGVDIQIGGQGIGNGPFNSFTQLLCGNGVEGSVGAQLSAFDEELGGSRGNLSRSSGKNGASSGHEFGGNNFPTSTGLRKGGVCFLFEC
ncbi:hypothetical protein BVRB_001440 [Beta vulgaris subsp. vulgaris]|uniref:DUF4216 domain-containing protein n=1 Tax=Beta vulgaris subsp. vulgaris TaxID=3555 RepID=A0A0J8B884_BETVV|nr:hypothetical protein BVRB_001440 [Beta vulgaris subsp. vulgaris]